MEALDYILLSHTIQIINLFIGNIINEPYLIDVDTTIPLINDFDHCMLEVDYL